MIRRTPVAASRCHRCGRSSRTVDGRGAVAHRLRREDEHDPTSIARPRSSSKSGRRPLCRPPGPPRCADTPDSPRRWFEKGTPPRFGRGRGRRPCRSPRSVHGRSPVVPGVPLTQYASLGTHRKWVLGRLFVRAKPNGKNRQVGAHFTGAHVVMLRPAVDRNHAGRDAGDADPAPPCVGVGSGGPPGCSPGPCALDGRWATPHP